MRIIQTEARAKINWALRVTGRRADGYHELDMLMQEISLSDTLTLRKADAFELTVNGVPDPEPGQNLIAKAVRALEVRTDKALPVRVELTKRIPSRAGLGGGSSDCAETLKAVNVLYALGLTDAALAETGLELGADVPYFVYGGFARVSGIGERVRPLELRPHYYLVLRHAGAGLSTPEVFRYTDTLARGYSAPLDEALPRDICAGRLECAQNDLEPAAFRLEPDTLRTLEMLGHLPGALHARMSGSGSAVYAVFDSLTAAQEGAKTVPGAIVCETV